MDFPIKKPIRIKRRLHVQSFKLPYTGRAHHSTLIYSFTMSYDNNLHAFLTCIVEVLGREFIIEGMTWDGEGCERVTLTLDTIPRGLLVTPLADLPSRIQAPAMHEVCLGHFTWTATSGTTNMPAPGLSPGSDGSRMDLATRLREAHH